MDLSIIIVTHNSLSPVKECLASLEKYPPSCDFETIVIDNASMDGTPGIIAEQFEGVRLVTNDENKGYSRGVNQGIRLSAGRMILIINPDIVLREGSIDRLMEFMQKTPDAGVAGSKLVYPDGRLQHSCRSFYTVRALILRRTFLGRLFPKARALREHLLLDYDHITARKVDWILGACMLVRREAIDRVGHMDERFFLYFEDIDWCYRMKNLGWSVYYVPESIMVHRYERSSAGSLLRKPFLIHLLSLLRYYEKWNRIFYFFRRYRGALKSIVFVISDLIAINLSFLLAYYIRDIAGPLFVRKLYPIDWYTFFVLFYNLVFLLTFFFGGLYRIRRETARTEELIHVARAVLFGLVILTASTYVAAVRIHSRAVILGQAVIAIFAVSIFRWVLRGLHRELVKANFDLKRVLLVGNREEAQKVSERLSSSSGLGIDIVGYIGDGEDSLGVPGDLPEIVERFKVQEVIVLPSCQIESSLLPFLIHSRGRLIQVRVISPLARILGNSVRMDELAGMQMFSIERGTVFVVWRGFKRAVDTIAAIVLLLPFAFLSTACRVYGRITGRIRFFKETRRGACGRDIAWPRIVMDSGAEAGDVFKVEICLHLITGRLSLVGPPPSLPSWHVEEPRDCDSAFKPGITGRWRIMSYEDGSTASRDELLEFQNWSLTREIMILVQSLKVIMLGIYPAWFYMEESNS